MVNTILVKLTNACNMSCIMCGQNIRKERAKYEYVKLENLIKFLPNDMEKMNLCLWGGEPLLYPDIEKLLDLLANMKGCKGIITNGYYLDKYIDKIIDARLTYLTISIDGKENTHNNIRNVKDAYIKAISNIKKIVEEKKVRKINVDELCININFTILNENINEMYDVARVAKDIGCKSITYNFPIMVDKVDCIKFSKLWKQKHKSEFKSWSGYYNDNLNIDCRQLETEIQKIKNIDDENFNVFWSANNMSLKKEALYNYFNNIITIPDKKICNISQNIVVINSNEDLLLCPDFTETVVGNIRDMNFEEFLVKKEKNRLINELEGRMPICARCCHRIW